MISVLPWTGCAVDRGGYDFSNDAGAAGLSGGSGGKGGATGGRASAGNTFGGNSFGARASQNGGGSGDSGGMAGSSDVDPGGVSSGGTDGPEPPEGSGGTETNARGGMGGLPEPPIMGSCEAGETEACGSCGERTCDAATLEWGECLGDGSQRACWETPEGEALPGEMPEEPKGACIAGVQTCQAEGDWSPCTGAVAPAAQDDCDVAGDDSDCDEMPNDGCTCSPGQERVCGKNDGNCQTGMQTCTANAWGPCEGEITPQAADSCLVTGDDANCNGMENETCMCVADDPNACNDNVACTDNVCNNGVCSNPVSAGFCRIGGVCYAHNAKAPGNPCQFCDANANQTAWSNSPSSVSCDDGLWCNGADTCSAGACVHEFTGNRCTATGPCALSTCDEARDSCFRPNTFACSSTVESRCVSGCGGDHQERTVTRNCSGSANTCNGATTNGAWANATSCNTDQTCSQSGSSFSCTLTLGCGSTWCDTRQIGGSDLCWTTTDAPARNMTDAEDYCEALVVGGKSDWRLPTVSEYLRVGTGCDGSKADANNYGTARAGALTCRPDPEQPNQLIDCNPCRNASAPNNGCYWEAGLGKCSTTSSAQGGYWSSFNTSGQIPVGYDPAEGHAFFYPTHTAEFTFRCVRPAP